MTPNSNMPQAPQQKGWFGRNWFWVVPVGCLVPMGCCAVFGVVAYMGATKMIKSSPVYAEGYARAMANDEVRAALGEPITPGLAMQGSVNDSGSSGEADIEVPLQGKKAKGTLYVVAHKKAGKWEYERIEVEVGGKRIDVLGGAGGKALLNPFDADPPKDLPDDLVPDNVVLPDDKPLIGDDTAPKGKGKPLSSAACKQVCELLLKCELAPVGDTVELCTAACERDSASPDAVDNYQCLTAAKDCAALEKCAQN